VKGGVDFGPWRGQHVPARKGYRARQLANEVVEALCGRSENAWRSPGLLRSTEASFFRIDSLKIM